MTDLAQSVITAIRELGSSSGTDPNRGFAWQLDLANPFIATAIHAGHHVREEILPLMALSEDQRRFEEDTATQTMISGLGNAVWGLESRAVYDLNRSPDMALPLKPKQFWGVRVYRKQPSASMNARSLAGYESFYRFMETCSQYLVDRFGFCIIYDLHSYNITRQHQMGIASPPVFNLGTALLDTSRWGEAIKAWLKLLGDIQLPGHAVTVAENLVFSGHGEFCRRLTQKDSRILALPTEVSKIYMDELTGTVHPQTVQALNQGLGKAVLSHAGLVAEDLRGKVLK
ncbi:MAG: N-formylglutamate amidohydrolase [Pseudomonadota bacterium]